MVRLIPVEGDPFTSTTPTAGPSLEPVDFDPFKEAPRSGGAPASGVFPATDSSGLATGPKDTILPPVSAPPPSSTPTSDTDPGIVTELTGSALKGWNSFERGRRLFQHVTGSRALVGEQVDLDALANNLADTQRLDAEFPQSPSVKKAEE